jgi:hypothetical protein
MNQTLSTRQLRLVVILGVIVLCVGGFLVVTRHKTTSPSTSTAPTKPATSTPAVTTPAPTKPHAHTVAPLDTHGLPVPIALALRKNPVVVVSVVPPRGEDEAITALEAKAAAAQMKSGYVALNVFHQRPGTAILRKLGVSDTPATLVVRRPGLITNDFTGFVDRAVVEQAIADAR